MAQQQLETDYLVIGAGASGMAFTDALISASDADVIMVDRRHAPGGHWHDAYPFVRLHQPSAYYGVNSLPLGGDAIDTHGPNAGFYEQASAPEICGYFDRVMQQRFLPSGRVRFYAMSDYQGEQGFVSRLTGERCQVKVRKKIVDARYLETSVPFSSPAPFEVAPEVRCVPVNGLARVAASTRYTIIGAGKTALDACIWLLRSGVAASDIRWIKPREAWLHNRAFMQGGELVADMFEGFARQLEAAAQASSLADLFERLAASGQLLRVDERVAPTMYRAATLSARELEELRRIEDVVRLGKVRRIERDRIVLEQGEVPTGPEQLHVHCATIGLNPAPAVPVFSDERIMLQPMRIGLIPFNAALTGYIEATRKSSDDKNRLCPPNRLPSASTDWLRGMLINMNADYLWSKEPDIAEWLERARLNPMRGVRQRMADPRLQAIMKRYAQSARPALAKLSQLLQQAGG